MLKKPLRLREADNGSNPTIPANAQAANDGSTPAQAATNTTPDAQAADGQEPITLEEARRLRSESKALRQREKDLQTKLKSFEDAEAQRQQATLTEQEKLQKQLAEHQAHNSELTRQLQEQRVRSAVFSQASALSIIDVDAAAKLLDWSEIDYDGNGNPTNIDDLLKQLVKAKPYLVNQQQRQAPTSGGATNPSRSATGTQTITKDYIAKLTPADYAAMTPEQKLEISRWIAGGGMMKRR